MPGAWLWYAPRIMDMRPTYKEYVRLLVRVWGEHMSGPVQFWLNVVIGGIILIGGIFSIAIRSISGVVTTGVVGGGALFWSTYKLWSKERNHVVDLQERTTPRLSISFEFREPWFIRLPTSNIPDPLTGQIRSEPSWWVRVQIQNSSDSQIAHGCHVILRNVEYSIDEHSPFQPTEYGDSLKLRWASEQNAPFDPRDISYAERRFVDVFSTDPVYNVIDTKWETRLIANQKLFSRHGVYRLTIVAVSQDAGSATIKLIVRWDGVWNQVSVHAAV